MKRALIPMAGALKRLLFNPSDVHGSSLKNPNPHHLYQIEDQEENTIFKYDISDDPIEVDGLSKRLRYQVDFLNLVVNMVRFIGKVLVKNIDGRKKAKELEDEYIDNYIDSHGERPRGNPIGGRRLIEAETERLKII